VKTRLLLALALAAIGAAFYVGTVFATNANGFSGQTLATATYDGFNQQVNTQDPQHWNALLRTVGPSSLFVQQNTWDPTTCNPSPCVPTTGWHTHPGPSFVIVTQGSVTAYEGDDPTCTPHVYTAGTDHNAFIDPGNGHVHIIRDESGQIAKTIAVQFIPAGATRRQNADDPGNCPFN
jgi:hypothetical protein